MSTASVWMALLVASTPGAEDDLSFADAKPEVASAPSPEAIEAHTTVEVESAPRLALARGESVFVRATVKLDKAPAGALRAIPVALRASRGISAAPWGEVLEVAGRRVTVRYLVRAGTRGPADNELRFVLEVRGPDDAALGRVRVTHQVTLSPAKTSPERIALDAIAYRHHQDLARAAYRALPELKDYLRLDRVDRPPSAKRTPEGKAQQMQDFLHHRLRADIARRRLRAAADLEDPALAAAAARAVGGMSDKPTGPAARARAIEGVTTGRALDMARVALDDLDVDVAEGFLNRLRTSGRLEPAELARALALLGGVYFLRGKDAAATRAYGGALCIDPELAPAVTRAALTARFEAARAAGGCPAPLTVTAVTAERFAGPEGPQVRIVVALSEDPYRVMSGAEVQLWGFGGRVDKARTVRVQREPAAPDPEAAEPDPTITPLPDGPHAVAVFPDDESSRTTDRALLKILVKDVSGVVVTTFGDPDPRGVAIAHAEIGASEPVPTWVWVLTGSVAVLGGAAAGIWALSRDREVTRGIGPVGVRF